MNRRLLVLSALLLPALHGEAAVMSRDWKTPGDGLLTFDDVNQREWLDLSVSRLSQFPGESQEAQYQSVLGQTTLGGMFEGFLVAKSADVVPLAESAGIDVASSDFATNADAARRLGQLLTFTAEFESGSKFAVGMLDEISSPPFVGRLRTMVYVDVVSGRDGLAGFRIESTDQLRSFPGVMLFRQIPEPPSTLLALVGLGGIGRGAFRRRTIG